jgi:dihydrolipoamide dehydrogenase
MAETDLLIIGGGPAGYVAAIRARQLGARVTLVEKDTLGGVCLNRGCIPTRAMVRAAELIELPRKAKEYGINFAPPQVDFAKIIARKDAVVKIVNGGVQLLMRENGVDVIKGEARFISPYEVQVNNEQGKQSISATRIIISTGAHTTKPSIPGSDIIITTTEALTLKEVPPSLLVLGAGPIGITFAVIFARLGSSVTVAEESVQMLSGFDREIISLLERELRREKVKLISEAKLMSVDSQNAVLDIKGKGEMVAATCVLIADSRTANVDGIGLDMAGVTLKDGHIQVNNFMQTNVHNIYAAGDVAGGPMLAHAAFIGGRIAAENSLGKQSIMDLNNVPRCVYSSPEIACVGLTEEEAMAQGYQIRVGRFPLSANGLATVLGERNGIVKVISETKYGQILGIHVIGAMATELIAEAVLAMRLEETPEVIGHTIHAHPTISEAMMEAALDVNGETLHAISKNLKR